MSIKRYFLSHLDAAGLPCGSRLVEAQGGRWVKYEDVKHLIKREEVRKELLICKEKK